MVFNGNVLQKRIADRQKREEKPALLSPTEARGRRAAGWRGLSVDLIENDDLLAQQSGQDPDKRDDWADVAIGSDEQLDGVIVQMIWSRSGLDRTRLSEFWNECDPKGEGFLDLDSFVKGMWRIDEELRRTQTHALKSTSNVSLSSLKSRRSQAGPRTQKPKDILR